MAVFVSVRKKEENKKKLSQILKSNISGILEAILLKFGMWSTDIGMWSTDVGGHVHNKNCFIS